MDFDQTRRKDSVASILPRRGSENWARSVVDGVRSMKRCYGDNIGVVKKGTVVGWRRDQGVGQEFGGGLEWKNTVVVYCLFGVKKYIFFLF